MRRGRLMCVPLSFPSFSLLPDTVLTFVVLRKARQDDKEHVAQVEATMLLHAAQLKPQPALGTTGTRLVLDFTEGSLPILRLLLFCSSDTYASQALTASARSSASKRSLCHRRRRSRPMSLLPPPLLISTQHLPLPLTPRRPLRLWRRANWSRQRRRSKRPHPNRSRRLETRTRCGGSSGCLCREIVSRASTTFIKSPGSTPSVSLFFLLLRRCALADPSF